MWGRWLAVALVVFWLGYEYLQPLWSWSSLWTSYHLYIKMALGVLAIALVVWLPSFHGGGGWYATLRDLLVDDRYTHHFLSSDNVESVVGGGTPTLFATDTYARAQFRDGVKLSRGDANIPDHELVPASGAASGAAPGAASGAASGAVPGAASSTTPYTIDRILQQHAPDVRRKVAEAQSGRCVGCQRPLVGTAFVVVDRGAACGQCAHVLGGGRT